MVAILDNIRSLHNVGSIFRTSDAAGIAKIYLCGVTPAPIDCYGRKQEALAKVALGAEQTVDWEHLPNILDAIAAVRLEGYNICALEKHPTAISLWDYHLPGDSNDRLAVIVGGEVGGLSDDVLRQCDDVIQIPMYGNKESLNVSVAFGICVYYFLERTKK